MPKKSALQMSVAQSTELDRRIPPPADLTEYQAQLWMSITATKPADWFQADCLPLLSAYCKHISTAAVIDQQIDAVEPEQITDLKFLRQYQKLLDMREKQTRAIASLATKMRLTPQSRYDTQKASAADRGTSRGKLWDQ